MFFFKVVAILIALTASPGPCPAAASAPAPPQESAATTFLIELRIYELLNAERAQRGLCRLELSPDLSELARGHSRDMAGTGRLSHIASSGRSFGERLTEGGFFFQEAGENVAFSETFVAEFIHKALMDSPDHRGEILRPEYDRVGIGMARAAGRGYYLTEDFVRSIIPLSAPEAERNLKQQINQARARKGPAPLVFAAESDEAARSYSRMKAGLKSPQPARLPGEVTVDFTTSGSLDLDAIRLSGALSPDVEDAGLGVWFGRDPGHPGGVYFITLLLLQKNPYLKMDPDRIRAIVLEALNRTRLRAGRGCLELDTRLSRETDRTSSALLRRTRTLPAALPLPSRNSGPTPGALAYITDDPTLVPDVFLPKIDEIREQKIGIGIASGSSDAFPRGAFWVTIVYR